VSRLQLALNVSNLDEAVEFYSTFFKTPPAKLRPGYANFAIEEPPLKLVLFEGGEPGTINHLGVEVFSTQEVAAATRYLADEGLTTEVEEGTVCCHALQDKVWVDGPDSSRWEVYTVLADADESAALNADGQCCAPASSLADEVPSAPVCC
jgi:catechol 2,3-dioxygenase-like lactoylglutathione lyase family enzyme